MNQSISKVGGNLLSPLLRVELSLWTHRAQDVQTGLAASERLDNGLLRGSDFWQIFGKSVFRGRFSKTRKVEIAVYLLVI